MKPKSSLTTSLHPYKLSAIFQDPLENPQKSELSSVSAESFQTYFYIIIEITQDCFLNELLEAFSKAGEIQEYAQDQQQSRLIIAYTKYDSAQSAQFFNNHRFGKNEDTLKVYLAWENSSKLFPQYLQFFAFKNNLCLDSCASSCADYDASPYKLLHYKNEKSQRINNNSSQRNSINLWSNPSTLGNINNMTFGRNQLSTTNLNVPNDNNKINKSNQSSKAILDQQSSQQRLQAPGYGKNIFPTNSKTPLTCVCKKTNIVHFKSRKSVVNTTRFTQAIRIIQYQEDLVEKEAEEAAKALQNVMMNTSNNSYSNSNTTMTSHIIGSPKRNLTTTGTAFNQYLRTSREQENQKDNEAENEHEECDQEDSVSSSFVDSLLSGNVSQINNSTKDQYQKSPILTCLKTNFTNNEIIRICQSIELPDQYQALPEIQKERQDGKIISSNNDGYWYFFKVLLICYFIYFLFVQI